MNMGFQTSGLSGFTRDGISVEATCLSCAVDCNGGSPSDRFCSDDAEQSVPQANGRTAVNLNFTNRLLQNRLLK